MREIMRAQRYRLKSDISAISTAKGKPAVVTIPASATLTVVYGPFNGTQFVEVVWDSETGMVFTSDLEAQARRAHRSRGLIQVLLRSASFSALRSNGDVMPLRSADPINQAYHYLARSRNLHTAALLNALGRTEQAAPFFWHRVRSNVPGDDESCPRVIRPG